MKNARNFRVNVLFLFVFILFVILIIRLGVIQIVHGEEYREKVSETESDFSSLPVPRGKMYDRYNRIVVGNVGVPAITYTATKETNTEKKLKTAERLAEYIDFETSYLKKELKDRDIKDYWLASNPVKAKELLSKEELNFKPTKTYQLQLDRISKEVIQAIKKSDTEMELAFLYTCFSSGYEYEPQLVKSFNLSKAEMARVAENLSKLPGINLITNWKRYYPYESLRTIFGDVSSSQQGILQSREEYYLVRDYSRNDRVGKSYLEFQYEDYLNPQKKIIKYVSSNDRTISTELYKQGERGHDLKLSFDIKLQNKVQDIIKDELVKASKDPANFLMDRAFVVIMDPFQGDILAMAGKQMKHNGKFLDFAYGTFTTQYEAGSTIKGATVLAGYQDGMKHGQVYLDRPLDFSGTPTKGSYRPLGPVSDLDALRLSSNVYMFHTAMNIADITYKHNGTFNASAEDFQKLRNYFAQFGLGVLTGIDLPNESDGLTNEPDSPGKLLDIAIGQFDTYTPLQLAQYVSTIANGGYRVQPRVVTSIHEPTMGKGLGTVVVDKDPIILNKVNNTKEDIERVQQGFKLVVSSGTAKGYFDYSVAGKTGTSQTLYYGPKRKYWGYKTNNLNFVGYYPSDNPKISFSVVVPWAGTDQDAINKRIANRIVGAYIDAQKNR
ncbi:penicillin-binding protein 2 (plasmid) [Metabacillus endolithicus]|nr:penicillin-binding protein 2 [Metabacillus endolithicus]UPG66281.1 penicillin-binding protein 2 [Metabacillus endolithicus]